MPAKHPPSEYLLDSIIDYADENELSLEEAASHLANYAQQRIPEYRIEQQATSARNAARKDIAASATESLVVRVLIRTRIHSISWTYYPKYHVIARPFETHWYSIWYRQPVWESFSEEKTHYIDDLFYDPKQEQFWMPEPYLTGLPASQALFRHITSRKLPTVAGTTYRKLDPQIVNSFLAKRRRIPIYTVRQGDCNKLGRRKPYGSKNWRARIKIVDRYSRIRK